jgi:hypothetical protein
MNASFFTTDRATHLKIGSLAIACSIAFVAVALNARTTADNRAEVRQALPFVAVVHPVAISHPADGRTSRMAAMVD